MSAKIIPITQNKQQSKRPSQRSSQRQSKIPWVAFHRTELGLILNVYGFMVSKGHWRDYAIDTLKGEAVFSIYRRTSEQPIYQIYKRPAQRNKQGQYSIVAPGGLILKRGSELKAVLRVFDKQRLKASL